eukprot:SAG31_NODE_2485_length_5624_cov_2.110206_4_plen_62_part_00
MKASAAAGNNTENSKIGYSAVRNTPLTHIRIPLISTFTLGLVPAARVPVKLKERAAGEGLM